MYCPCDHQICFDRACAAWGCRVSGAAPLETCQDCGEPFALMRRLLICDVCLATYVADASGIPATSSKG